MNTKPNQTNNLVLKIAAGATLLLVFLSLISFPTNWWLTNDQQAERLMRDGKYAEAAEKFDDPIGVGIARYRNAEFEKAASEFGRIDNAEAAFNRGNALVMLGKYDAAISSYDRALQFEKDWNEAKENRAIAVARRDRMDPGDNTEGGTGGQLGADEIVFDDRAKNSTDKQEVEVGKGGEMSDLELRELWLQRVQTKPSDFLKIKFSYQLSKMDSQDGGKSP